MSRMVRRFCYWQQGQDIAEYAVMLVVILVIVIGTVKLISSKRNSSAPPTDSFRRH
jgi:Flp pilus assembly pilin Flp